MTRPTGVGLVFAECLRAACEEPVMSWFGSPFCGTGCRDAHRRENPGLPRVWFAVDAAGDGQLVKVTDLADGHTRRDVVLPPATEAAAPPDTTGPASQPDQPSPASQPDQPASAPRRGWLARLLDRATLA